jgi:hypothetical protein
VAQSGNFELKNTRLKKSEEVGSFRGERKEFRNEKKDSTVRKPL